jgi:histone acetyltransferase (RNA polymerase elongator complex component)
MRHVNIPLFIPHLGCPNQCVFCNQRTISGVSEFDASECDKLINEALSTVSSEDEVEIAFFGGSFTGIDFDYMVSLLKIAYSYVECGKVSSIRCSTRPDYIDEKILDTLKRYGVKTIELGLQSTDNDVLTLTKRGHTFADELRAAKLIVDQGFELVGQMMIGLPGSTLEKELKTAEFIINSGAKGVRIYPTVVFRDTELCQMTIAGGYKPLSIDEAIDRSSRVFEKFIEAGIEVIRIGLCASDNLISDDTYYAGPNHPALGELIQSELYYKKITDQLKLIDITKDTILNVYVSTGALSKAVGQRKRNKLRLLSIPFVKDVRFIESDDITSYEVLIRKENGDRKCI